MTYLYSLLIMGASLYICYFISKKYEYRDVLLKHILELTSALKNNLLYRKDSIENVFISYMDSLPANMKKPFESLMSIALNPSSDIKLSSAFGCLKKEEKQVVQAFFKSLGQGNEKVESERIENFRCQIEYMQKEATEQKKKNQPLAIKLSLAVGLMVSILII